MKVCHGSSGLTGRCGWSREASSHSKLKWANLNLPKLLLLISSCVFHGWRKDSRAVWLNSGSSSKNSTPRWLKVILPGRRVRPRPPGQCLKQCGKCWEDATAEGRKLRFLTVVDEFTRESKGVAVGRRMPAREVIRVLGGLFHPYGTPQYLRSDNGPEFIAWAIRSWLQEQGVQTHYIDPGSPWQNAYGESFNSKFRDEFLNLEVFYSLVEAEVLTEQWRCYYNQERPHSSLGTGPRRSLPPNGASGTARWGRCPHTPGIYGFLDYPVGGKKKRQSRQKKCPAYRYNHPQGVGLACRRRPRLDAANAIS